MLGMLVQRKAAAPAEYGEMMRCIGSLYFQICGEIGRSIVRAELKTMSLKEQPCNRCKVA